MVYLSDECSLNRFVEKTFCLLVCLLAWLLACWQPARYRSFICLTLAPELKLMRQMITARVISMKMHLLIFRGTDYDYIFFQLHSNLNWVYMHLTNKNLMLSIDLNCFQKWRVICNNAKISSRDLNSNDSLPRKLKKVSVLSKWSVTCMFRIIFFLHSKKLCPQM